MESVRQVARRTSRFEAAARAITEGNKRCSPTWGITPLHRRQAVDHAVAGDEGQVLALFLGPIVFRHRWSCAFSSAALRRLGGGDPGGGGEVVRH